jgi:DNA-binding response OmpR family regulator
MSGYTSDAVLRHGIETGKADFLQKPFSTSALAAKLRQVLDRPITVISEETESSEGAGLQGEAAEEQSS